MTRQRGLSFYKKKKKINPVVIKEIFSTLFGMAVAAFIAFALVFFFGMSTNVVGVSMEPVLYNGQTIYINRFAYALSAPDRGDVIVFRPNGNVNVHYYVKRVIAVPGDEVQIVGGICYVNGEESPYVTSRIMDPGIAGNGLTMGSGEYFCLGDNPNNSEDSRSANIGAVKDTDILGQAWFCLGGGGGKIGLIQ